MESHTSNLLVIGGRSLVGRRLRQLAGAWPGTVRLTSRTPLGDQSLILDFSAPESLQPKLSFATVIVCVPIWLINERLLKHLCGIGMRRLVAFSSTSIFTKGASGTDEEREVVERLSSGEKSTIEFCSAHNVAWTILRPTLIYDEGQDENVTRIAAMIRKFGVFPVCAPANGLRQPVHARDLAHAALAAATAECAHDKAYNVPGGEDLTYRAMVERIFLALGRRPAILPLPEGVWRLGFGLLDLIRPGRKLKRNINMALRMNEDLWFDASSAVEDFGYAPGSFQPDFKNR